MGLAGCSDDNGVSVPDYKQCTLSVESLRMEGFDTECSFDVTTSDETMWLITPDENLSWMTFPVLEGRGSGTITATFSENPLAVSRTGTLRFEAYLYGERYLTKDLTVEQMPKAPYLDVDETAAAGFEVEGKGAEDLTFEILSNQKWTITVVDAVEDGSSIDWIIPETLQGEGSSTLTFDVEHNISEPDGRIGYLCIAPESGEPEYVKVSQDYYAVDMVSDVVLTVPGMSGYLPAGNGTLVMTQLIGGAQKRYTVTVTISSGNTVITFDEQMETGLYILNGYEVDATTYTLGEAQIEVTLENTAVEIPGWDANFKTFGGISADNPIYLSDEAGLRLLATVVNKGNNYAGKYFKLANDIQITKTGWTPIGNTKTKPFSGNFDGDSKVISGLSFTTVGTNGSYKGLFGVVSGKNASTLATISNVVLQGKGDGSYDIEVTGVSNINSACGAIAGLVVNNTVIKGCRTDLHQKLGANCGAIVGSVDNNSQGAIQFPKLPNGRANVVIEDCHNTGNIDAIAFGTYKFNVGGITGVNMGIIRRCSNTGNMTGLPGATGFIQIGGIVGINMGEIHECYNTGTINSSGASTGGIVGFGSGVCEQLIQNCYNTGDILTPTATSGGIMGNSGNNATLTKITVLNCYSTSANKSTESGALFGTIYSTATLIFRFCAATDSKLIATGSNSYAADTEQLQTGDRVKAFTATEMKSGATFTTSVWASRAAGWDFTDVWAIDESSSTPYLRHNEQIPHPTVK